MCLYLDPISSIPHTVVEHGRHSATDPITTRTPSALPFHGTINRSKSQIRPVKRAVVRLVGLLNKRRITVKGVRQRRIGGLAGPRSAVVDIEFVRAEGTVHAIVSRAGTDRGIVRIGKKSLGKGPVERGVVVTVGDVGVVPVTRVKIRPISHIRVSGVGHVLQDVQIEVVDGVGDVGGIKVGRDFSGQTGHHHNANLGERDHDGE